MFAMVGDCQCTCRNGNRSQEQGRTRLPFPCCRIASPAAPAPSSCPPTTPDSPHHRHRHRLSPPPRPPPTYSKLLQDDKRNLFESFPITYNTARIQGRAANSAGDLWEAAPCAEQTARSTGRSGGSSTGIQSASRRRGGWSGGAGSCSSPAAWGASDSGG